MSILDNILDSELDDLADLPEFVTPPAGAYAATIIAVEEKEIGEHPAVEVRFKLNETLELANPNDTPVVDGTETSIAFLMDNEFGVGNFKKLFMPVSAHYGIKNTREVIEAAKGTDVMLVTKVRLNKNDKTQKYMDIVRVEVV
jgi:hypothetical protein